VGEQREQATGGKNLARRKSFYTRAKKKLKDVLNRHQRSASPLDHQMNVKGLRIRTGDPMKGKTKLEVKNKAMFVSSHNEAPFHKPLDGGGQTEWNAWTGTTAGRYVHDVLRKRRLGGLGTLVLLI